MLSLQTALQAARSGSIVMKVVLVLVAVFAVEHAYGHMCLLSPHQRGDAQDLNYYKAFDCRLVNGPCGDRTAMPPTVTYKAGSIVPIIFQKNKDHFYSKEPGNFTIMIGEMKSDIKLTKLLEMPDTNATSGHIYSPYVKIPDMPTDHAVLQVTYAPNHPKPVPSVFYQCADVRIVK